MKLLFQKRFFIWKKYFKGGVSSKITFLRVGLKSLNISWKIRKKLYHPHFPYRTYQRQSRLFMWPVIVPPGWIEGGGEGVAPNPIIICSWTIGHKNELLSWSKLINLYHILSLFSKFNGQKRFKKYIIKLLFIIKLAIYYQ